MATQQPPRSQASLDVLEQTIGEVLVHTGKAIRAQSKDGRIVVGSSSAAKVREANTAFNSTLDSIEMEILHAKATIRRDLDLIRARTSATAGVAADLKKENNQISSALYQAPAATMDIDLDEPNVKGAIVKVEPNTDSKGINGSNNKPATGAPSSTDATAPFPNMNLDSPVTPMSLATTAAASTLPLTTSNRPTTQAPQAPKIKSPTVKRETLSRSPRKNTKNSTAQAASTAGASPANKALSVATGPTANKAPARKRTVSPVATRVPSPVLVKSTAGSNIGLPAIGKDSNPQPPKSTPVDGAAGKTGNVISLLSSSPSSSVGVISPVLAKKVAAPADTARMTPPPMSSTISVPAPRAPAPVTAPAVPILTAPAPATATPIPPPLPASAPSAPSQRDPSTDTNMGEVFDLTSPTGTNSATNPNLGHTNTQLSGAPAPLETAKQAQSQPLTPGLAQQHMPQAPDDSEFDVESFTADAVQNLLMDTSLPAASTDQMQPQPIQQQQPPQSGEILPDAGAKGTDRPDAKDAADDIFSFMDDEMQGLGDDPTSFDELYMGATDSIDIDDYFDTN
ncbi:hypothetical protein SEPCBS57363_001663 [Sporothrix epigloea]|uniref:Uncharacterized protein n=1 Tax=Sporothrix epigloea TaxID=1892477 RepID=A0ABP0DBK4_9PEZI